MIGKDQFAAACRENDSCSDRGISPTETMAELGFKPDDVNYVAIQRALRMYAVLKGTDASKLTTTDLRRASSNDRMLIAGFATAWTDGVAAAARTLGHDSSDN